MTYISLDRSHVSQPCSLLLHPFTMPNQFRRILLPLLRLRSTWLSWLGFTSLVALLFIWIHPVQASQVQIAPTSPRLGDTLSIVLQREEGQAAIPGVQVDQKPYPMFSLGPNRFRALVPTTPLEKPRVLQVRVEGGEKTRNLAVQLKKRSFPVQQIWLPPGKSSSGTDLEFDRVDAFKKLVTPEKFWQGTFQRPNRGEITAGYGIRRYYNGVFAKDYYHRGIDYGGGVGSPVMAPAAGRVALIGLESQGFKIHGNTVGIDHGQGITSIFLHLSRIDVKEGDFVQAGQRIGAVGATGAVTGPHLHWGLYVQGLSVDPTPWRTRGFE
ncbi:MAG: M23 family metallopeptidase [Leptolyngbyaceae cyanobacterium bins.59]|nr:M23 family metallopeptidase [Leptolyngbyaceae cyanobacterium bins.59]